MDYIDLHVHSTFSDGSDSPTELVQQAVLVGLSAFALTDHDTVAGISEAEHAAAEFPDQFAPRIIPGIELSAAYKERDIHILGLLIDPTNQTLLETLDHAQKNRENRNRIMLQRLNQDGFTISEQELLAENNVASITRSHFAKALVSHGYAKNTQDVFTRLLGLDCPYYVPRDYITPEDAIALIKRAGGVAVLAHPLLYHLDRPELEQLICQLTDYGLSGLEAIYSTNSLEDEQYIRTLASRNGLLISGGSDYHGMNKPHISLGTGRGNLKIPFSILEQLEQKKSTSF